MKQSLGLFPGSVHTVELKPVTGLSEKPFNFPLTSHRRRLGSLVFSLAKLLFPPASPLLSPAAGFHRRVPHMSERGETLTLNPHGLSAAPNSAWRVINNVWPGVGMPIASLAQHPPCKVPGEVINEISLSGQGVYYKIVKERKNQ